MEFVVLSLSLSCLIDEATTMPSFTIIPLKKKKNNKELNKKNFILNS